MCISRSRWKNPCFFDDLKEVVIIGKERRRQYIGNKICALARKRAQSYAAALCKTPASPI